MLPRTDIDSTVCAVRRKGRMPRRKAQAGCREARAGQRKRGSWVVVGQPRPTTLVPACATGRAWVKICILRNANPDPVLPDLAYNAYVKTWGHGTRWHLEPRTSRIKRRPGASERGRSVLMLGSCPSHACQMRKMRQQPTVEPTVHERATRTLPTSTQCTLRGTSLSPAPWAYDDII